MTNDFASARRNERRKQTLSWLEVPRDVVVGLVALFVAIEAIGAFVSIPLQVVFTAFATFLALNISIFGHRTERTAGLVMAAVFTTRLITLTLPLHGVSLTTRGLLLGPVMVVMAYVATWVIGMDLLTARNREGFPLKPPLHSRTTTSILTALTGIPLGWLVYQVAPESLIIEPILGVSALGWAELLLALLVIAFGEELIFRRLVAAMVQHTANSQTPWFSGILYGSIFFASHNPMMVLLAFGAGTLWAASCERTGSLHPVIAAHSFCLIGAYMVFPAL